MNLRVGPMKPLPCKAQQSVRLNSKTLRCQAVSTAPVSMCVCHTASNCLSWHELIGQQFRSPVRTLPQSVLAQASALNTATFGL